jgi:hypothetical protein
VYNPGNWNSLDGGDDQIEGPFTINSISLHGTSDASVRMDDVFYKEPPFVDTGITAGGTLSINTGLVGSGVALNGAPIIGGGSLTVISGTGTFNMATGTLTFINGGESAIGAISTITPGAPTVPSAGYTAIPAGIPGTVLVPEPVSLSILAVGTFALSLRRTRRGSLAISR